MNKQEIMYACEICKIQLFAVKDVRVITLFSHHLCDLCYTNIYRGLQILRVFRMNDESDYYSTHDQMRDLVLGVEKKVIKHDKVNELDDIRRSLRYILDKLSTMDRYMREKQYSYRGRVMDGEAYRKEVIEKFLTDLRDHTATDEDKAMFKNILSQPSKRIEKDDTCKTY